MKPRHEADIRPGISRRHRAELPGFRKQVLVRCRHRYISRSWSRGSFRFFPGGITASAPRRSNSLTSQSASNALSPTTAPKERPFKSFGTTGRSCAWPGRITNRTDWPSASASATALPGKPPRERPIPWRRVPPGAPAAFRCAWTTVPSIDTYPGRTFRTKP